MLIFNKVSVGLFLFFAITSKLVVAVENPVVYEDVTGASVEIDPSTGAWSKIRSSSESILRFGDRQDVLMATRKATLAAKAEIAKFLNERVTTTESVNDITKLVADKNSSADEVATRKAVETMTLEMHNSSEAILRGILTLEQKVDTKNKVVRVTVGMSKKSLSMADGVKASLSKDNTLPTNSSNGSSSVSSDSSVKDDVRRSKNYDSF
jgi:hypothetical protein